MGKSEFLFQKFSGTIYLAFLPCIFFDILHILFIVFLHAFQFISIFYSQFGFIIFILSNLLHAK